MSVIQHPIGTPLYFVPIRFWEPHPIETGTVAVHHGVKDGEIWNSFTHDGFVYAYHNGYGHNVYMTAADTFLTVEGAMAERDRRAEAKRVAEDAEMEVIMERIMARFQTIDKR